MTDRNPTASEAFNPHAPQKRTLTVTWTELGHNRADVKAHVLYGEFPNYTPLASASWDAIDVDNAQERLADFCSTYFWS